MEFLSRPQNFSGGGFSAHDFCCGRGFSAHDFFMGGDFQPMISVVGGDFHGTILGLWAASYKYTEFCLKSGV